MRGFNRQISEKTVYERQVACLLGLLALSGTQLQELSDAVGPEARVGAPLVEAPFGQVLRQLDRRPARTLQLIQHPWPQEYEIPRAELRAIDHETLPVRRQRDPLCGLCFLLQMNHLAEAVTSERATRTDVGLQTTAACKVCQDRGG